MDALKNYAQIIAQKNAVLKKQSGRDIGGVLDAFDAQLAGYIRIILKNRHSYTEKLNRLVRETHRAISGGEEEISIEYKATIPEDAIPEALARCRQRELAEGGCTAGPHRDDLEIRLNGKDIRVLDVYKRQVREEDIRGQKRNREYVFPRQIAMFILRDLTDHSYSRIAEFFGRDHSTIMHAEEKIKKQMKDDPELKKVVEDIEAKIKG